MGNSACEVSVTLKSFAIVALHAAVGWALCGATMGIGMAVTTLSNAMLAHLGAAPLFFIAITWVYARRFAYTGPMQTALLFLAIVVVLDVFVAALLIQRSFAMFTSVAGVWLPLLLIGAATYLTARLAGPRQPAA
ncbi:MAG: hypothetical protein HY342_09290 [Candidatus Lambdaproteobacteria bacterium]|nr:hypothetical protein [Candidatus Lambdaproteobacteria bacterium]